MLRILLHLKVSNGPMSLNRSWSELSPTAQTALLTAACVQVSLAVTAWVDLARRPAGQVRGPKPVWAAVIALDFVGPVAYFVKGRAPGLTAGLRA